jgi:hypothetical protein
MTPIGMVVMGTEVDYKYSPDSIVTLYACPNSQAWWQCEPVQMACGSQTTMVATGYITVAGNKIWSTECAFSHGGTALNFGGHGQVGCAPINGMSRQYPTYGVTFGNIATKLCCRPRAGG